MKIVISGLAASLFFSAGFAVAADAVSNRPGMQNGQATGRQMMNNEERREQRAKMRSARSAEEREKIRAEHHEKMKQRAQEKGVSMPDKPPVRGGGMGGGQGGGQDGRVGGGGR